MSIHIIGSSGFVGKALQKISKGNEDHKFKFIENDKIKLNSAALITELKNYVATGTSFRAKVGQTDDLVSATLLALRMMAVLKDWDPRIYNSFSQADGEEVFEPPMPIYVTGGLG